MNAHKNWWLAAALCCLALRPALAQRPDRDAAADPLAPTTQEEPRERSSDKSPALPPRAEDHIVTTSHRAVIGGQEIRYTATAGTMILRDEDGKPRGVDLLHRLHAGRRQGPRASGRSPTPSTAAPARPRSGCTWAPSDRGGWCWTTRGCAPPPPYRLVDNDESLLDVTDLVFIDPVTTGYSRADPGQGRQEVPRRQRGRRCRSASSSGSTPPASAAGRAPSSWPARATAPPAPPGSPTTSRSSTGIYLNGIVLLSSILNFQTARFDVGNDLPYPLFLPTYTATAWYHKRLPADLQAASLEKAVDGGPSSSPLGEYTLALMQGNSLTPGAVERRRRQGRPLHRPLGGLRRADQPAAGDPGLRQGAAARPAADGGPPRQPLQGAWTATPPARRTEFDPSYAAIHGPYTAVLNDYVRRDLGFKSDLPYEILTGRVRPWNYGAGNQYLERGRGPAPGDEPEPGPQGLRGQRLLRPGDALLRGRVHLRAHRLRAPTTPGGSRCTTTRPGT